MAMFNGVEDRIMDQEEREALEMSAAELLAKAAKGKPARVARKKPFRVRKSHDMNQEAAAIVAQTADGTEFAERAIVVETNLATIVISNSGAKPERPLEIPLNPRLRVRS